MRELCAGANVDIGTAAALREQWRREVQDHGAIINTTNLTHLLLRTNQAPGDAVVMTAAIYSLHRAYPGQYKTSVDSLWLEVFEHNPDVVPPAHDMTELVMHYPAIHQSNRRGIHFMHAWCEHISSALNVDVPLLTNRPHLYFSDTAPPMEDYWLVCSGGKGDFTCKDWGDNRYQQVIDILRGSVKFVQVGNDTLRQPQLNGAHYMVGKTSLRHLFWLCAEHVVYYVECRY